MKVRVVGGGLAGVEAAYQLLIRGAEVDLYEMRPINNTAIHKTGNLAELVCSNSLKSEDISTPQGALKKEMILLNSLTIKAAQESRVPAGSALAVDRELFSRFIERTLTSFPNFNIIRNEVRDINDFDIIATGPLSSDKIVSAIIELTDASKLYFYDAVSPIVTRDSIDMSKAFFAARYDKGSADYLNCPMSYDEYNNFIKELVSAKCVILKDFEKKEIFSSCMPIEEMARMGEKSLTYGPLRPVGLTKKTEDKPYAIVQLRKEDNYENLYNLVGFQTNLTFQEQRRVFRMIPALSNCKFVRYGVMHKNIYVDSPKVLNLDLSLKANQNVFFAGQLIGVEGYMESAATGILAGINMYRRLLGKSGVVLNNDSMLGSLVEYATSINANFQPMHVSKELIKDKLDIRNKAERKMEYSIRAVNSVKNTIEKEMINNDILIDVSKNELTR